MAAQARVPSADYGAFLLACIAEADREHSPEEVEAAEAILSYTHLREKSFLSPQEAFSWNG